MKDKLSRLIILSAFISIHHKMDSLTLLRFAFACNMSKIVIITKDREIAYERITCEPVFSPVVIF